MLYRQMETSILSVQKKSCISISEPIIGLKAEVPLLNMQEKRRENNNVGKLGKQGPKKRRSHFQKKQYGGHRTSNRKISPVVKINQFQFCFSKSLCTLNVHASTQFSKICNIVLLLFQLLQEAYPLVLRIYRNVEPIWLHYILNSTHLVHKTS